MSKSSTNDASLGFGAAAAILIAMGVIAHSRLDHLIGDAAWTILLGCLLACFVVSSAVFLINRNVVRRQRAGLAVHEGEEPPKAIMDDSAAVILRKDTERRFLLINRPSERPTRITNKDAQGETNYDLFPEAAADASKDVEKTLLRARDELEIRVQERTAQLTTANESLKALTSALTQSNRQLQEFAEVASHDLQEPLRKILAFGGRLRDKLGDTLPADGLDCLARMQSSTQRMRKLIDDLLSFSRVTTKARSFVRVDLARVAEEVLSDLEARVAQTNGHVEIGNLPVIEADETQMHQLLQNLIGNALKFHHPETPPLVKVHGQVVPEEPATGEGHRPAPASCQIVVEDNGIGFDEAYLDRIFKPFQRLHTRSEGYEGTGIGLAICCKIVERHGGKITARSASARGATFVVTLPMSQTRHADAGQTKWNGRESGSPSASSWPTMTLQLRGEHGTPAGDQGLNRLEEHPRAGAGWSKSSRPLAGTGSKS